MRQAIIEQLNNAIYELSWVAPSPAADALSDSWQDWWDARGVLESLGPAGTAIAYGQLTGYWLRYRDLYDAAGERQARLPTPREVQPTMRRVLTDAQRQFVRRYHDLFLRAQRALRDLLGAAKTTYQSGLIAAGAVAVILALYVVAKRS